MNSSSVLALTLQGMQGDMARLDRVAFNLANAQTTGFKRELLAAQPGQGGVPNVQVDARPGTLRATGRSLDLAFAGPGWFEVLTPEGPAYTRQGDFRVDAQGRLLTAAGRPVMGTSGEIQLPHGMPLIDVQGRVFEGALPGGVPAATGAQPIAQLKLVAFDPKAFVRHLGEGLVAVGGEARMLAPGETELRQGHLENSNVSSMHEMVQLLQTMRHFESLQKAAVGYDEMLGAAIRKLGDTP